MKNFGYLLLLASVLCSCAVQQSTKSVGITNGKIPTADSVVYELIITDPGFDSWFISHSRPLWYHSEAYYKSWNQQYVTAWNEKALSPRYSRYFETTINWDPFTDYGLEINHKLFHYFLFVEKELKINILPQGMGPRSVL